MGFTILDQVKNLTIPSISTHMNLQTTLIKASTMFKSIQNLTTKIITINSIYQTVFPNRVQIW